MSHKLRDFTHLKEKTNNLVLNTTYKVYLYY